MGGLKLVTEKDICDYRHFLMDLVGFFDKKIQSTRLTIESIAKESQNENLVIDFMKDIHELHLSKNTVVDFCSFLKFIEQYFITDNL